MKPSIIHSIIICLAALVLPVMVACSSQDESLPEVDNSFMAVFTLDLGDTTPSGTSRSTPADGEYKPGSGLENYIDFSLRNFRCYLFGTDNRFIKALETVSVRSLDEKVHLVSLRLKDTQEVKDALATGCRFVFMANWNTNAEPASGMTIEELCAASYAEFEFSQEKTVLSAGNLIPMYGVKEFESGVPDFKDGKETAELGTVRLLRAFAKVDVKINFVDFAETPAVTSVSLTHSNSKGYKAPANVTKEDQYVTGSWLTDYTPVNIPVDATDIEPALTYDANTGSYIAYVPEYRNVNDLKAPLDNRSRIRVCFTIGNTEAGGRAVEKEFDFRYSDNPPTGATAGQHFDIARNNWYKFSITAKGKDIEWTVDVIPFTGIELNPDYGLKREEFTGYIVGRDKDGRECWYVGNYYAPAKAVPLYLGPKEKKEADDKFVTINGKEYLLVYADYERTAAKLDHFFEKMSRKKYLLDPAGRTEYSFTFVPGHPEWGPDIYYNKQQMRVWLDEDKNGWKVIHNPDWENAKGEVVGRDEWVPTDGHWYRTLNEWDRLDWNKAVYDKEIREPRIYPKYWFDVFGNRYSWSDGDTKEKRKNKLIEKIGEDWIKYLE